MRLWPHVSVLAIDNDGDRMGVTVLPPCRLSSRRCGNLGGVFCVVLRALRQAWLRGEHARIEQEATRASSPRACCRSSTDGVEIREGKIALLIEGALG